MNTFIPPLILFFVFITFPVKSVETETLIKELSFGTIAVLDNSVSSDVTMNTSGQQTSTNQIRTLVPGYPAEVHLTGYPVNSQVFTTANITNPTAAMIVGGPGEELTLISVNTAPSVIINEVGFAVITIGGTLRTSGTGPQYNDTLYRANISVTLNF
ncbi:MAG: hypothetical protein RPR97_03735 [Colwellia sp.]